MEALEVRQGTALQGTTEIGWDTAESFISYIDASPKTVATYTRATRQFIKWLGAHGITRPTREDVIAFREELKQDHKEY